MRFVVLASTGLMLLTTGALAQYPVQQYQAPYQADPAHGSSYPPPASSAPYGSSAPQAYASPPDTGGAVGAPINTQPDPQNCGTPDEPKACPPMPRRARQHY